MKLDQSVCLIFATNLAGKPNGRPTVTCQDLGELAWDATPKDRNIL